MKNVPNFRMKKARKGTRGKEQPVLFACGGNDYCQNYDGGNVTCINCCENNEGPYRAGCFKRGKL